MLEGAHHEHARIALEDVLGAVAVMHVEVDHRHARQSVRGERVRRADRDAVEEAEAHRAPALGVVSRRAHRAERGRALAAHHEVDPHHDRAGRVPRRGQRVRVERRVGVDVVQARFRARRLDLVDERAACTRAICSRVAAGAV